MKGLVRQKAYLSLNNLLHHKVICKTVYSGPEKTPDFSRVDYQSNDESWESKKLAVYRERIIELQNGRKIRGMKRQIIDQGAKQMYNVPHNKWCKQDEQLPISEVFKKVLGNAVESTNKKTRENNLDPDFYRPDVQALLQKINCIDPEKLFAETVGDYTEMPTIRLLTSEQLNNEFTKMKDKYEGLLEMPPVMLEREEIGEMVAFDPELNGYEEGKLVFTDISQQLTPNQRVIVIREPDGKLRTANWEERDRILDVYFEKPHRKLFKDPIFEDSEIAFRRQLHVNLLEKILINFEPDSADFLKYTHKVYDDIDNNSLYDLLRSTRFYCGFLFYLAKHRSIDGLVINNVEKYGLSAAADVVRLFVLINPESQTATSLKNKSNENDLEVIKTYVQGDATNVKSLQLILESFQLDHNAATV